MIKLLSTLLLTIFVVVGQQPAFAQSMSNYTAYPPFINQSVPPLVMINLSKDHRMFIMAYNDIMDLNGDGTIETTYTDIISYYGYFDPNKCYTYSTANSRFQPAAIATGTNGHYCSNQWSGNFLNWATMARIDVVRKVLYGGMRSTDTSGASGQTVLRRTWLPQDAHSFAKAYSGSDLASLVPTSSTTPSFTITSGSITLCNTNTAGITSQPGGQVLVFDGSFPYSASTESKAGTVIGQCTRTQNNSTTTITVKASLNADVLVCVPGMLEANCDTYQDNASPTPNTWYKPTGLMQRMGVNRQGTYNNPSDDTIQMKFALISGSYGAQVGGGVLRSNIVDMSSEIDPSLGVVMGTSQIINNINNFHIIQYSFSKGWYYGTDTATSNVANNNCNQGEPLTLMDTTGYCKSWGNPMGEMFYETIRYFMGKSGATPQFQVASPDFGVAGLTVASSWSDPYASCPYCSKAFALVFSDAFPSYDSDHLPGYYSSWAAPPDPITTSDTPSVTSLITNSQINTLEGILGNNVFIGQSGTTFDRACTPKPGDFTQIRGLCIDEPVKQGSFYLAGLANYANVTDLRGPLGNDTTNSVKQNITTYSVVTNNPFPILTFSVGSNTVRVFPDFHDGCPAVNWGSPAYTGCASIGTNGDNSKGELVYMKICPNDADWTTEQGNGFTSCYEIMWDDAENGWDYDLDVLYRIYVQTNSGAGTITLKTKSLYAAAGHTDYAGFFINGVTNPGPYLDQSCGGVNGFNGCNAYNNVHSIAGSWTPNSTAFTRTFTVTGTTTQTLNNPLWYAAKYGGFIDQNGNNVPDLQSEWDADGNGVPDTYFSAVSPLYLEQQLANAFASILNRASSGTAASVLASSTTGTGAVYQSFFFPTQLQGEQQIKWTGYTEAIFVDNFGNLREDTDHNGMLTYEDDYIIVTYYDPTSGSTKANRFIDANGDGKADSTTPTNTVLLTQVNSIWEAGNQLATQPSLSSTNRRIWTWVDKNNNDRVDNNEFILFNTGNDTQIAPFLNLSLSSSTCSACTTDNVINFVRGQQITGLRNRQLTVGGSQQVWKLGDPIYSTPTIVGAPLERYDVLYGDPDYAAFYSLYKNRRQVAYVGANDGMLHAFNVGFYTTGTCSTSSPPPAPVPPPASCPSHTVHGFFTNQQTADGRGKSLGNELWAFVPQALLPHLQWLARTDYTHVYYVDLKPKVTDARIFTPESACSSGPTTTGCIHPGGWGTILIGGFRMGGSCGNCSTTGQGAPMTFAADFDGDGTVDPARSFYSAYFVLDITNPETDPTLLWVFSDPTMGFATTYPAIARVRPFDTNLKTSSINEKWYTIFGSGPTSYDATVASSQVSKMFMVDLANGPSSASGTLNDQVKVMNAGSSQAFLGDLITVDKNFDFRVDVAYVGQVISGSPWSGKLLRLATGCISGTTCNTDASQWGIPSAGGGSPHIPTELVNTFTPVGGSTPYTLGPTPAAPAAAVDNSSKLWVFLGTGRFFSSADKTDTSTQYLVGAKDPVMYGGDSWCSPPETTTTGCSATSLVNLSNAQICVQGVGTCGSSTSQVQGVPGLPSGGSGTYASLIALVAQNPGWFTTLLGTGERMVSNPSVLGGIVFYPSFIPNTDVCVATGNGYLYALYYVTGGPYSEPVIGTTASGANQVVNQSMSLGQGLATTVALHIGSQGNGQVGGGSQSGLTGCSQSSTGAMNCVNINPAMAPWSRYVSWINQRD